MHALISAFQESLTVKLVAGSAWTAFTFFCGAYVGHRFNLFRDKRKEFNSIADKVHLSILKTIRGIDSGIYPSTAPSQDDIDVLIINSPRSQRKAIEKCYAEYINIHMENVQSAFRSEKMRQDSIPRMRELLVELSELVQHK